MGAGAEACIPRASDDHGQLTAVNRIAMLSFMRGLPKVQGLAGSTEECSGGCTHSIYIGNFASLTVTRSRFERGTGGHYVKHRGAKVAIIDNSFDDTGGTETNYMIDLPNGSTGRIAHNMFVQGTSKDNHSAFIVVGANDTQHASRGLTIEDNDARFAPGVDWTSNFVVDFTGEPLVLRSNRLATGLKPLDRR